MTLLWGSLWLSSLAVIGMLLRIITLRAVYREKAIAITLTERVSQLEQLRDEVSTRLDASLLAGDTLKQKYHEISWQNAQYFEQIAQYKAWREKFYEAEETIQALREQHSRTIIEKKESDIKLDAFKKTYEEKVTYFQDNEKKLLLQFESLANQILLQSETRLQKEHETQLLQILTPFRHQLDLLKKQVNDSFLIETKERHTLTYEVKNLQQLNTQLAQQAINLTNALKGNNKTQGCWGEIILEKVLELSGLREGYEYSVQTTCTTDSGHYVRPDIIVHLPHKKQVIIDSKLSLVAYERYFNAAENADRQAALSEHLASIRTHVRQLGKKAYHNVKEIQVLDYVLLFVPIEPAFTLAIEQLPSLIQEAADQNVMLVSPTTLLVALRTIEALWRYEKQTNNAKAIAEQASGLYDKFYVLMQHIEKLGKNIEKSQEQYHEIVKRITKGRGNLVRHIEKFRILGVSVARPLEETWIDSSETEAIGPHAVAQTPQAESSLETP